MKNPRLKPRKPKCVAGWLTRDVNGKVVKLWDEAVSRDHLVCECGCWFFDNSPVNPNSRMRWWDEEEFKKLYTGIPRKGRAVYVQMEIVVE